MERYAKVGGKADLNSKLVFVVLCLLNFIVTKCSE